MEDSTKLMIGGALALAAGYYFFVYKPANAVPAPGLPTGQTPTRLGTGAGPAVAPVAVVPAPGAGSPVTTPVTLTQSLTANDLSTGMTRDFKPGEKVLVYGTPLGGITTFSDEAVQPHLYTTQQFVGGYFGKGSRSFRRAG